MKNADKKTEKKLFVNVNEKNVVAYIEIRLTSL
jgi:hypothetical protein